MEVLTWLPNLDSMLQFTPSASVSLLAVKRRGESQALKVRRLPRRLKSQLKLQRRNNMPLVKSKTPEAFRKNIKAEVKAGKPVKQAVAIAYAVKREAEKKKK
jgi:hypothetical protein